MPDKRLAAAIGGNFRGKEMTLLRKACPQAYALWRRQLPPLKRLELRVRNLFKR